MRRIIGDCLMVIAAGSFLAALFVPEGWTLCILAIVSSTAIFAALMFGDLRDIVSRKFRR